MLVGTAGQRTWMATLEREPDNVRAALAWSVSADGVLGVGVALAGALGWFWLMSGRLQEAQSWYAQLLARRAEADDSLAWTKVLHGSALQLWGLGDLAQAAALEESAVGMFRIAGESRWLSYSLALLARVRTGQERLDEARALLEEARVAWSQVETTYGQPFDAYLRYYLGSTALVQGDADTARGYLESSLREIEAAGDDLARGVVLASLGLLAAQRGEHAEARARFADGLPLLRPGGDQWDLALLLLNAGLEEAQAASPAAAALLADALRAWQQLRGTAGVAFAGRDRGRPRAAAPRWPAARRGPGAPPGDPPLAPRHRAL
jgi:tetratricopeptide (TPR) repeat protein